MSGEWLLSIGNPAQLKDALGGTSLQGRREPRIAMVGRSNVGKSSLINALVGTRLAQTSAEPGKTRILHFYVWKEARKIVADLPGYGYARTSKDERNRWAGFIEAYLKADPALLGALVLLDARHGPTDLDEDALKFLLSQGVNVQVVFTKADTLKTQALRAARKREAAEALRRLGIDPDGAFWVSSKYKDAGLRSLAQALMEM